MTNLQIIRIELLNLLVWWTLVPGISLGDGFQREKDFINSLADTCFCCIIITYNERTKHFFIKMYLSFYSRKEPTGCCLRDRWKNIYSERGLFLAPYLLLGARGCQRLHPCASHIVRDVSDRLRVPGSTLDSLHRWVITWSPSGYTPVGPGCPDTLSPPCLLITTWQLVKAHRKERR